MSTFDNNLSYDIHTKCEIISCYFAFNVDNNELIDTELIRLVLIVENFIDPKSCIKRI